MWICRVCISLVQYTSMHLNLDWDSCVQAPSEVQFCLTWVLAQHTALGSAWQPFCRDFSLFCYTVLNRREASVISSVPAWKSLRPMAAALTGGVQQVWLCNSSLSSSLSVPPTVKCSSRGISEGLHWQRLSRLMPRCHIWKLILHLQWFLF